MSLYFITGNANKSSEAKSIIADLEQLDIDLPEIQGLDPKLIIKEKLNEAFRHHKGQFIVDDVSLYLECLNGLPGPLIKWFMKSIGIDGIVKIAQLHGNTKASVSAIIGYAKIPDEIYFFEGSAQGQVVTPRGKGGFGWDPIFLPDGTDQTFGEWKETHQQQPNAMRTEALTKLKQFLSE
jgi:inosine triphosphate pyrophosphatase